MELGILALAATLRIGSPGLASSAHRCATPRSHPGPFSRRRQACLLRRKPGTATGDELAHLCSLVGRRHATTVDRSPGHKDVLAVPGKQSLRRPFASPFTGVANQRKVKHRAGPTQTPRPGARWL
jgi:hypothetical protein